MATYFAFRNGMPPPLGWLAKAFAIPILLIRCCIFVVVTGVWVFHGPKSVAFLWNGIVEVQESSQKITPKKESNLQRRIVNFDDVRTRISELTQDGK